MKKTALLFAGQGAQSVGMGNDLAAAFPTAREWFLRANSALGYDLSSICFQGPEPTLTQTEHAQPGIYLVGWVALMLLKERVPTFEFQATAGLSLGEFTALAAAGALSFDEGIRVVRQRGIFMQEACNATQGGMAAVIGLDEEKTRLVCREVGVTVANLNCPGQIVVSGPADLMATACERLKAAGAKKAMPLKVAGAYHSPLMAGAQPKLRAALAGVALKKPLVDVVSNVTGAPHGDAPSIADRLVEQVTGSVLWEQSIRHLLAQGYTRFIELGPGKALSGFMKRINDQVEMFQISDVPSLEATVAALTAASPSDSK